MRRPNCPLFAVSEPITCLCAPAYWQSVDFAADLHLQQDDATWQGFARYLQHTSADAVFLLGDILELWAGDDALQHPDHDFERLLTQTLRAVSQHKALYFMPGNRDFLVGAEFCTAAGLTLLHDPCVLQLPATTPGQPDQRILLSHGDALCIADTAYMQFRQQVRNPAWQQTFLQQPLEQRLALARQLRQQSSLRKNALGVEGYADVDEQTAEQWLQKHHCTQLIHGHTHKPDDHVLPSPDGQPARHRKVLSDWDLQASPPRGDILNIQQTAGNPLHWTRHSAQVF